MHFSRYELAVLSLVAVVALVSGILLWTVFSGPGLVGIGGSGPGLTEPPSEVSSFGFLWRLLIFLIPFMIVALLGGGLTWWLTVIRGPRAGGETCPTCQRPIQADWQICPYCGFSLADQNTT